MHAKQGHAPVLQLAMALSTTERHRVCSRACALTTSAGLDGASDAENRVPDAATRGSGANGTPRSGLEVLAGTTAILALQPPLCCPAGAPERRRGRAGRAASCRRTAGRHRGQGRQTRSTGGGKGANDARRYCLGVPGRSGRGHGQGEPKLQFWEQAFGLCVAAPPDGAPPDMRRSLALIRA